MSEGLRVLSPGILTLVQDLGRFGFQHLGLTPGGAADEHAFLWANRLLGNPANSPALEICFGGLHLEVEVATRIALTGADLQTKLNGRVLAPWQTHHIKAGDRLRFGYPKSGVRAYLAVQGGFCIQPVLGSASTVMREKMGGLDGQGSPLQASDLLPCEASACGPTMRVPSKFIPDYSEPLTLRIIEGSQAQAFHPRDLERFYSEQYQMSNQSDRMGVRLSGPPLYPLSCGIISEGTAFGSVQVPPNGQPIILLKDRQTIGGYPKLGTVFALDAFALAQRQPHTRLSFKPMALEEAQRRLARFYGFFGA